MPSLASHLHQRIHSGISDFVWCRILPTRNVEVAKWAIMCAASAVTFVGVGFTNTFGVFQDVYQTKLFPQESSDKIILIGSVASSLYMILGVITGPFADAMGYRVSLGIGSALMVGGMFTASICEEFWQYFLAQGVMFGLGVAFVYMPATTISRQYFGKGMHGFVNGFVVSGGALGGCLLPYFTRLSIARNGLPQTFRILGYLATTILVPSILLLRPKALSQPRPALRRRLLDFSLLKDLRFIGLILGCTVAMTGFLPRYFLLTSSAEAQGINATYSAWLLGIMNGLSIFGRLGIGIFADHYGKLKALSLSFILCGMGHLAFWCPGVGVQNNESAAVTTLFTLFVVFIGIFGSGFISLFPVVVADLFGSENLASKTGLLNTALGLSSLAGPSTVYAIVGSGMNRGWIAGVVTSGVFMVVGGFILMGESASLDRTQSSGESREGHEANS